MYDEVLPLRYRTCGETELTRAIAARNYEKAAEEISAHRSQEYLNDGPAYYTPLYMVLCGEYGTQMNFHLASLLVQHGADTNLRFLISPVGREETYTRTPFQLLFSVYSMWSDPYLQRTQVIGIGPCQIRTQTEYQSHIERLVQLFINYGADVNTKYYKGDTILHVLAQTTPHHLKLVQLLCENDADVNVRGRFSRNLLFYLIGGPINYYRKERQAIFHYLLRETKIDVNARTAQGVTSLHLCMLNGDFSTCLKLVHHGADTSARAKFVETISISDPNLGSVTEPVERSVLFSPLFVFITKHGYSSHPEQKYKKEYELLSLLVDRGLFSKPTIQAELLEQLEFFPLLKSCSSIPDLVEKMYGYVSSGLMQLCVRMVTRNVNMDNISTTAELLQRTVLSLGLPLDTVHRFYLEAFKVQMAHRLIQFNRMVSCQAH